MRSIFISISPTFTHGVGWLQGNSWKWGTFCGYFDYFCHISSTVRAQWFVSCETAFTKANVIHSISISILHNRISVGFRRADQKFYD